jgi:hypothetical protein
VSVLRGSTPREIFLRMSQVARLKITLDHVKPTVLRRIEVPADISLEKLHLVIQIVMGWGNCHLYAFRTAVGSWSNTNPDFGMPDVLSAEDTTLADLLRQGGAKAFEYVYDFGDDWAHSVKVEAVVPEDADSDYPRLLEARSACPPEDCGGPWGYAELLAAVADPRHQRHAELTAWLGPGFDPAVVDDSAIRQSLAAFAKPRSPRKASSSTRSRSPRKPRSPSTRAS